MVIVIVSWGCELGVLAGRRPVRVSACDLLVVGCWLWAAGCGLWVAVRGSGSRLSPVSLSIFLCMGVRGRG